MPNGAAVALKLVPAPEPPTAAGKPDQEATIGAAVADVATLLAAALQDHQHGDRLDSETREAGGIRVARLVGLWLANAGSDHQFVDMARQQGKERLRQYLPADFVKRYSAKQGDAALDFYLDSVFAIATRVITTERALRMAEAH